jgi:hypothetical protein
MSNRIKSIYQRNVIFFFFLSCETLAVDVYTQDPLGLATSRAVCWTHASPACAHVVAGKQSDYVCFQ